MITRDNYEEFFLLYTDNELSAAERHAVERFVADHPDLREEWEALLQCRVAPDTRVTFPERSDLLKPEMEGSAWTGDLLSYMDDELDPVNTARIEAALAQHPLIERELATLRQTISHPDLNIAFPEKDRLYKTEKDKRIIPLPWLRAGIAAAIAGTIALLLLLPSGDKSGHQPDKTGPVIAEHHDHDTPVITHKIIPTVTPPAVPALNSMEGQPGTHKDQPAKQMPGTHKDQPAKQIIERREPQQPQDVTVGHSGSGSPVTTPGKVDPVTEIHDTREIHDTNPVTTETIGSIPPTGDLASNIHLAVQSGVPKEQSSFATQALQEEDNDQRNNIFITDESAAPGRGALRGIFRKVKRAFGKTAERDSDGNRQVLVGAFQVSID